VTRAGPETWNARSGEHDDLVLALGLAVRHLPHRPILDFLVHKQQSMVRAPVQSPVGTGLSSWGQSPKARLVVLMTEGALVESADQMKQQLAAGLSEGQVAEFVENERSPSGVTQEAEHRISRWVDRMAAGFTEPRCASERGLAMGGGRPAERRFTVGGSGKSVARCHRTVLAYWKFESISLQQTVRLLLQFESSREEAGLFRGCAGRVVAACSAETRRTRQYRGNRR
jgi:hypothetical protein